MKKKPVKKVVCPTKLYDEKDILKVWEIVGAKPSCQSKKQQKDEFYANRKMKTISYDDYFEMSELQSSFEDELNEDIQSEDVCGTAGFASSPVKIKQIKGSKKGKPTVFKNTTDGRFRVSADDGEQKHYDETHDSDCKNDKHTFSGNAVIIERETAKTTGYEVEGFERE